MVTHMEEGVFLQGQILPIPSMFDLERSNLAH